VQLVAAAVTGHNVVINMATHIPTGAKAMLQRSTFPLAFTTLLTISR
jgi:hypothetical protein